MKGNLLLGFVIAIILLLVVVGYYTYSIFFSNNDNVTTMDWGIFMFASILLIFLILVLFLGYYKYSGPTVQCTEKPTDASVNITNPFNDTI